MNKSSPTLYSLSEASRQIFTALPVRKNKAQKQAFREQATQILENAGWAAHTESSGKILQNRNLVAGNPDTAKVIFTAHYDTPARLLLPNFLAPRNLLLTLLFQIVLALLLLIPAAVLFQVFLILTSNSWLALVGFILGAGGATMLLLVGPANPTNANDNTSGTLTLLEIAQAMPEHLREHVALVFFDNEELGLVGAAAFRAEHGCLPDTLLLNFDCVGEGDTLLLVPSAIVRRDKTLQESLPAALFAKDGLPVLFDRSPLTLFPSDQLLFKQGVGVVALTKRPVLGLCVARIHTKHDVILQPENLLQLRDGAIQLTKQMQDAPPA